MTSSLASRLGLFVALLAMVACGSAHDVAPTSSTQTELASATELNNRGVALMRDGIRARLSGNEDEANQSFLSALDCLEQAIGAARDREARDYDKAWANKAYVLWRVRRWDDAVAAAREVRRITPGYALNPQFVEAMAAAGHPVALATPPESTPPETEQLRKLTNAYGPYYVEGNPFEE